jgi:hypothetical protein
VVAAFGAAIDGLLGLDVAGLSGPELLGLLAGIEVQVRRLPGVDHRLIADLEDRRVAAQLCQPNTAALLRGVLRLAPHVAKARVKAAADLGPRRTLTGEVLPALFERVAAAQAGGVISIEHARLITATIDRLPYAVEAEHGREVEATLVEHAVNLDPAQLGVLARRVVDYLDPDGTLADDRDQQRARAATLNRNRDGSFDLRAHLSPQCGAAWLPVMDTLARPRPGADGAPDPRSAPQRMHDALHEIPGLLQRAQLLPECGGLSATLIIMASAEQLQSRRGFATTGHGELIPISTAIELVGDGQTISVVFDAHGGVLDYGQTRRIVPAAMRLALVARDRGCTFPGCDRPAAWCQAHHLIAFADGGPTSLANTTLACGYHHREHPRLGWRAVMINGVPHWIPPSWFDPTRTPARSTMHDPSRTGLDNDP